MLERLVENHLIEKWELLTGGKCVKFPPLFYAGFPDRICLAYPAIIVFVETKAPKETPRKLQVKVQNMLRGLGFRVENLDTYEKVDAFVDEFSLV